MKRSKDKESLLLLVALTVWLTGCVDREPVGPAEFGNGIAPVFSHQPPAPSALVNVAFGSSTLELWPFAGTDLEGSRADPINILFTGQVDVLSIRAALLALDGNRTAYGLPPVPPFNCTWKDAFGDVQTSYSGNGGWTANAVQIACGNYDPVRFHLRLFAAGNWVIGGTHFDLLIPNSAEHQVISWELAQQLVVIDMLRTGRLHATMPMQMTAPITPVPSFRTIPAQLYNALPASLRGLIGGPAVPVSADVPIANDGVATMLNVASRAPVLPGSFEEAFTLPFDLVIPRPFCSTGPLDFVYLQGAVTITNQTTVTPSGVFSSNGSAYGELQVTPIDITTGLPSGTPFAALIENIHVTGIHDRGPNVNAIVKRIALPPATEENGSLITHLVVGPREGALFTRRERC